MNSPVFLVILKAHPPLISKFRLGLFFLGIFLLSNTAYSHDAKHSYFEISQNKDYWQVRASLPWTIRAELLKFNPSLEQASANDYQNSLRNYWEKHFFLIGSSDTLQLHSFNILQQEGHHLELLVSYGFDDLICIENTLLLDRSPKQKNEHRLKLNETIYTFVFSAEKIKWCIPEDASNNFMLITILLLFSLILIGIRIARISKA